VNDLEDEHGGLIVNGVSKSYGDHTGLSGVDLRVGAGEVHGLLGRNGAGKTTLLGILLGLIRADSGVITHAGVDIEAVRGRVPGGLAGCVEEPRLYPYLTGRRTLRLLARLDDPGGLAPMACLDRVGLSADADRRVGSYSLGMRARLVIAASLMRRPGLLVLDEPTSGLDPVSGAALLELLRELAAAGTSVIVSSHDLVAVADVCDRVTILRRGRVVLAADVDQLTALAPQPVFELSTPCDQVALRLADSLTGLTAELTTDGLVVRATDRAMDGFVLLLASRGIPVRRLHTMQSPLRALFDDLTSRADESLSPSDTTDVEAEGTSSSRIRPMASSAP